MDYALAASAAIGACIGIANIRRDWTRPSDDAYYQPPQFWLWGVATWQAALRISMLGIPFFLSLATILVASGALESWAMYAAAVMFCLFILIMAFNWPKFLVYPGMRGQSGLVQSCYVRLRDRFGR